jgi:hypothetical protein
MLKRYQVLEVTTGQTVQIFDDKRRAESLAASLNAEYAAQGLRYKVKAIAPFGLISLGAR